MIVERRSETGNIAYRENGLCFFFFLFFFPISFSLEEETWNERHWKSEQHSTAQLSLRAWVCQKRTNSYNMLSNICSEWKAFSMVKEENWGMRAQKMFHVAVVCPPKNTATCCVNKKKNNVCWFEKNCAIHQMDLKQTKLFTHISKTRMKNHISQKQEWRMPSACL